MSRQAYAEALTYTDENGFLKGASSAEVFVYKAGTSTLAEIFSAREGGSPSSNPFIVPATGLAMFWADTGDYDIKFHDTKLPARFGDYEIGWQSTPVNPEIDASDLSSKGEHIEWTQELSGAWLPTIKKDSITLNELKDALDLPLASLASGVQQSVYQSGDLKVTAKSTVATGWLLCNGESKLRSEYTSLFAAIGTTYGSVDGTHFTLPDIRGRSLVGVDGGAGRLTANNSLGKSSGEEKHVLTVAELAVHAHAVTDPGHVHMQNVNAEGAAGTGFRNDYDSDTWEQRKYPQGISTDSSQTGISIQNSGSGTGHNNMHPYLVVNFLIKT